MEKSDVKVYLSTTRHLVSLGQSNLRDLNVPVCSVITTLDRPAKRVDKKALKRICLEMAMCVYVNAEKQYVFVGENSRDPDSSLLEYTEDGDNKFGDDFFKRWNEILRMVFEFNVYDNKKRYLFSLKGQWDINRWYSLKIEKNRLLMVMKPDRETIISRTG